ncbi:TIGR04282 family arsenosugar biosynthesis glycosyltransferase [Salinisphaera aquimarina]
MSVANPPPTVARKSMPGEGIGLLIFAKAPEPGRCKTRLARRCGNRRAARLYRAMLENAVASARQQFSGYIALLCAPDIRHPFFKRLARRYDLHLVRQARGDLGERMQRGAHQGLRDHSRIVLMGSDQPALDDDWLAQAHDALGDEHSAWLAPTHDGGYWAIGLRRSEPRLFRGPHWSTPRVAGKTMQRMRALNLDHTTFATRRDVDEWRDWKTLSPCLRARLARAAVMPGVAGPGGAGSFSRRR